MTSIIFKTASQYLLYITFIFSIWVLFRGHNAPGGGFIGGLVSASGFALYLLANGAESLRKIIKIDLQIVLALGFSFTLLSGLLALFQNKIFLTSIWIKVRFFPLQIGSPILFDVGVYLIVLSSVLTIILLLEESYE